MRCRGLTGARPQQHAEQDPYTTTALPRRAAPAAACPEAPAYVALYSAPLRWLMQPPLPLLGETFVFDICRPPRQDLDLGWGGAEPPEPPPVTAGLGGRTRWGSGHYYKVQQFFVFDSGHHVSLHNYPKQAASRRLYPAQLLETRACVPLL